MKISDKELELQHTDEAIADRLETHTQHGDLGDLVLGAVDGAITTFAIVSGVAGTGIQEGATFAFVLGVANVLADGFSMGASNYLKVKSDQQNVERFRKMEEIHIERVPDSERKEVREIYRRKGFSGEILDEIVNVITGDKELWINTMLREEWGLHTTPSSPVRSGMLTFGAFLVTGVIPLLPLLLAFNSEVSTGDIFLYSALATLLTFLLLGAIRGKVTHESPVRVALETFFVGGTAAFLSFFAGNMLGGLIS